VASVLRWLIRIFAGLAMLAVAALGLAYYLAGQSLPDYRRSWTVDGVTEPLEIVRDVHAIPHILSRTDADAFFGLGFVHAQDRLWQMMMLRRTAQGRLSELFGRETLHIDELMRALDLHGLARAAMAHQSPATTAALEAYAAGVNAWLRVVQEEALGRGAPEFFLFEARIAPWIPADSLAVQKLIALQLTDKAAMETLRARLSLRLPPERLGDILPDAPGEPVIDLPDYAAQFPGATFAAAPPPAARHPLDPLAAPGMAGASNAFAATARRAAGGAPLLAADPHLGLTAPSIWMLARLDLEAGPVMGGTMPGMPTVLIGRNDALSWGLTSSYLDDQDLYIERLNPENPEEYLTPSGWQRFRTRETLIEVKDAPTETRTLRWTRHGPVIPGNHFGVAAVTPEGHVASLAWTALSTQDTSVEAAMGLMRARSVREAREAARGHLAPSLNLILADAATVGQVMTGRQPVRQIGHTSRGRIPAPGWLAANDWQGLRDSDENPAVIGPEGGIVVNTNNPITDAAFPDHVTFDWGDAYRIVRAERLLNARQYHTLQSFIDIQTDSVAETARVLLPLIARDLWYSGEPASEDPAERRRQVALERLANWNGEMSEHLPEPLIYAAWVRALQRRLAVDRLGVLVDLVPRPDPVFLERVFRDIDGAGEWCDVVQTTRVETCTEMARLALDEALVELTEDYGSRIEAWRWGAAHQAVHEHQTLGTVPLLRTLVNIRHETAGGDNTLLKGEMPGIGPEPYINIHSGGLRMVVDFSDPDSSVFIIATGQSGHVLSRHYDDMAGRWRRGEYVPMSLDPELARAGAIGVTRLVPRGAAE
jgi:penicillin G amidase